MKIITHHKKQMLAGETMAERLRSPTQPAPFGAVETTSFAPPLPRLVAADEIFIAFFLPLPIIIINIFTDLKKMGRGRHHHGREAYDKPSFGLNVKIVSSNDRQERGVTDGEIGAEAALRWPLGQPCPSLYTPSQTN